MPKTINSSKFRFVPDSEYLLASQDLDNKRIIGKVLHKYGKYLSQDERKSCGMVGLWKALGYFRPNKGTRKFTSSVYLYVKYECLDALLQKKKLRCVAKPLPEEYRWVYSSEFKDVPGKESFTEESVDLDEILSKLPEPTLKLIKERFLEKRTIREIGNRNGCCFETARQRILDGIQKLRDEHSIE